MKDKLVHLIEEYNIVSGIIFMILAIVVLLYQIKKNESFRMKDHGILSWKAFVNIWAVVLILLMFSFFLIFKY